MPFGLDISPIYVLVGVNLLLLLWLLRLEWRLGRFLRGKTAASLEEVLNDIITGLKTTGETNEQIRAHLVAMETRLQKSIQHVKTIRFNPFRGEGQGSNQSFAVALLDEHGDGVVISSLYTRDNVSVYAKPIAKRASEYELSEEERAAL